MLRLILNSHPTLSVPFETDFLSLIPVAEELGSLSDPESQAKLLEAFRNEPFTKKGGVVGNVDVRRLGSSIETFGEFIDAVFTLALEDSDGKTRWGVKTPTYVTEIDVLNEHFPAAQIIHIVRDGRDVALSLSGLSWGSRHIPRVARNWANMALLGRKIGRMLGRSRYLEIKFEELVRDTEAQVRLVCDFLNEPFDESMLSYHVNAENHMPKSSLVWHRSSVSAPDPDKAQMWKRKMTLADQIIFDEEAGPVLSLFGYERVDRKQTIRSRLKRIYYATT
jgi:hypothetical protein